MRSAGAQVGNRLWSSSGMELDQRASRATPAKTSRAALQRRLSTFSCRKKRAATAFVTNVSEAAAGATRLTSAQERAVNRAKKPRARKNTPARKILEAS